MLGLYSLMSLLSLPVMEIFSSLVDIFFKSSVVSLEVSYTCESNDG